MPGDSLCAGGWAEPENSVDMGQQFLDLAPMIGVTCTAQCLLEHVPRTFLIADFEIGSCEVEAHAEGIVLDRFADRVEPDRFRDRDIRWFVCRQLVVEFVQDAGNVIVKRYAVVICAPGLDMLGFIAEFLYPGSDIIVAETSRFLDPSIFARKQLTVVENLVQQ